MSSYSVFKDQITFVVQPQPISRPNALRFDPTFRRNVRIDFHCYSANVITYYHLSLFKGNCSLELYRVRSSFRSSSKRNVNCQRKNVASPT